MHLACYLCYHKLRRRLSSLGFTCKVFNLDMEFVERDNGNIRKNVMPESMYLPVSKKAYNKASVTLQENLVICSLQSLGMIALL